MTCQSARPVDIKPDRPVRDASSRTNWDLSSPLLGKDGHFLGHQGHCHGPRPRRDRFLASPHVSGSLLTDGEVRIRRERPAATASLVTAIPLGGGPVPEPQMVGLRGPGRRLCRYLLWPADAHGVRDHHRHGRHDDEEIESD